MKKEKKIAPRTPFPRIKNVYSNRDITYYRLKGNEEKDVASCFATIGHLWNDREPMRNFRIDVTKSELSHKEIYDWLNILNEGYGVKLFTYSPRYHRVGIHLERLKARQVRHWSQILGTFNLVRYLYEEWKPMVVRGALYLRERHPKSDVLHCITASDILMYHVYEGKQGNKRMGGHSLYSYEGGTKATFAQMLKRLEEGNDIINSVTFKEVMNPLQYSLPPRYEKVWNKIRFDVRIGSNSSPLNIINKWFESTRIFVAEQEKQKEQMGRLQHNPW